MNIFELKEKAEEMIKNANSLNELCATLNEVSGFKSPDGEDVMKEIDLSCLPLFGGSSPIETSEVWSWDEDNVLLAGNDWYVESRCKQCDEADIHCNCGN